jgi:AcrR family transcriptional regulator
MLRRASTPRAREGKSTRECVLDVAEHHFAEHGFAGTSMREIATEAGLRNQASLYNHFPGKQALYEAVLGRGLEPIVDLMVESRTRRGRSRRRTDVGAFVERVLDYLGGHPDLPRLIQRAALDDNRRLRGTVTRLLRPVFAEGLTSLAEAGASRRPEELPYLALGLYHLIFGYFANVQLLEIVGQRDPLGPSALARQRAFVKAAVNQLLAARPAARGRLRLAR